jgi:hypothetical protein
MKAGKYAKLGNKQGRPGYRTQATFRFRAIRDVWRAKAEKKK